MTVMFEGLLLKNRKAMPVAPMGAFQGDEM
jgi:hypothetical protein